MIPWSGQHLKLKKRDLDTRFSANLPLINVVSVSDYSSNCRVPPVTVTLRGLSALLRKSIATPRVHIVLHNTANDGCTQVQPSLPRSCLTPNVSWEAGSNTRAHSARWVREPARFRQEAPGAL